jgi:hypothetical protein
VAVVPKQSPEARRERGRIGALSRSRAADDPELRAARRFVAREHLERHIEVLLADLTRDDRVRMAALLVDGDGDGAGAAAAS